MACTKEAHQTIVKVFISLKTDIIFENSKIPFRIWFAAIYLCTGSKKGISSVQLAIHLGITQKTAWFVLHRVREMLKGQAPQMLGGEGNMVEADETYVGGIEKNRHKGKRLASPETGLAKDGTVYNKKKVVLGLIERNGKVILKHLPNARENNMVDFVKKHIPKGSTIFTDEAKAYKNLKTTYTHDTVNHSLKVYVVGKVHTNTIENFWSVLKRGLYGVYHQVSDKHLEAYLNEFASRFNARQTSSFENFNTFLSKSEGGLLYKNLIAKD